MDTSRGACLLPEQLLHRYGSVQQDRPGATIPLYDRPETGPGAGETSGSTVQLLDRDSGKFMFMQSGMAIGHRLEEDQDNVPLLNPVGQN